ncbi:MAG TPA: MopE-related protein [Myxococcota bacterium]|nr:MopE-related protein [Myxococcota bacterium]
MNCRFSLSVCAFATAVALAAISCGDPKPGEDTQTGRDIVETAENDTVTNDVAGQDAFDVAERDADTLDPDDTIERDAEDAGEDIQINCPGGAWCACEGPADCDSNLCVQTLDGSVCSTYCDLIGDSCPQGWSCENITTGSEPIYGCVYPFPNLCKPCMDASEDCAPAMAGDKLYLCVEFGPEGSFCSAECVRDTDCPSGFSCEDIPFNGDFVKQCMPIDNVCPCSDQFVGKLTECYDENEFGRCYGTRTCATQCTPAAGKAMPASAEACNKIDDDCDGTTDEDVPDMPCDLVNSFGTCVGKSVCQASGVYGTCQGTQAQPEICNGADEDCDGLTDDGFPDDDTDGIANCVDPDIDGDGISNALDNCPYKRNPGQENNDIDDEDGPSEIMGDACDPDDDNDGIPDVADNCRLVKNSDQANIDGDEFGDACDCDKDGDGKLNAAMLDMLGGQCTVNEDNCPAVSNAGQENTDGDARGDVCDCDIDDDGIANNNPNCPVVSPDNCPYVENIDQLDINSNNKGDACDCDADSDTVANNNPNCPVVANPDNCVLVTNLNQRDIDHDNIGDACDCDIDDDGVFNNAPGCPMVDPEDNCPFTPNPDQDPMDCDNDYDGDLILNEDDNCQWDPNPLQEDQDVDSIGDVCDCDADDDGIINSGTDQDQVPCVFDGLPDNCRLIANPLQDDLDTDFIGDACDCDIDGDDDPQAGFNCPTPAFPDCEPYNPDISHNAAERCGNQIDDDCDGMTDEGAAVGCSTYYYDNDDDGYGSSDFRCLCKADGKYRAVRGGDCDDNNFNRNPGVQELCSNGLDDNCNGSENDENALNCINFYYDNDADNYGTNDFKCYCASSGLYSARFSGDCDDNSPSVNPGIKEICFDGKDNDCTGSQNDVGSIGCTSYYYDFDNDGYGTADTLCLCVGLDMYRATATNDCDDFDNTVKPVGVEICNNEKDDNCDGVQDTQNASGCQNYFIDQDGDGYGATGQSACLCNPDSTYKVAVGGDCKDNVGAVHPDQVETCNNIDDNCSGATDENPSEICPQDETLHSGIICVSGSCQVSGCAAGWFDVNKSATDGCECAQDANDNNYNKCTEALDLGALSDSPTSTSIIRTGRIVPDSDVDWYKISATDLPDAGTLTDPGDDAFRVRAWIVRPTDGSISVNVHVGSCSQPQSCADGADQYVYDVSGVDKKEQTGQGDCINATGNHWTCCSPDRCEPGYGSDMNDCCGAAANCTGETNPYNIRECSDDSKAFYIKVYRTEGSAATCSQTDYELRITNGK